jgi:hypothetical protein
MKTFAVNSPPVACSILWIGSNAALDSQIAAFRDRRSIQPRIYTSLAMPSAALLSNADAVFIYEVEIPERFQQLKVVCEYQRRCGGIQLIFGLSRCLQFNDVPKRVVDAGAQFLPLFVAA